MGIYFEHIDSQIGVLDSLIINVFILEGDIHAKIERKNDTYYLVDCGTTNRGSTNFTYLEDEQLQPMEEYALGDGMKIRLADEEFEFYLY